MPTTILVISGSTRQARNGRGISDAIALGLSEDPEVVVDLADLAEISIPLDAEPWHPRMGQYQQPSTKAWSQRVTAADAVVLVTPEYNGGYPAGVKNALDALANEWVGKPFAVASYGARGGARAFKQISEIITNLGAELVEVEPGLRLSFGQGDMNEQMRLVDPAGFVARYSDAVRATGAELVARAGAESVSDLA
ncbi:NAD(P)H-dependent oxidoreductase [Raineyella sp. LH-20]|uniref:NADPH-dependent FMN reductase n=1 Tax=Raineyella sp. LH-20 TaxID=3081204 RepID=UPI0029530D30|nr:NAD(P)H-dependent oxidoreductase [Raineyella sp. LH-20]WOP19360.1 NAD(P)H-dependent oxidoreductase [Raineyella sp. LH-20]